MADLQPFCGVRFNPEKVADVGLAVSPPYDVIDAALQQELYRRSPHNIVRLDLGLEQPGDRPGADRYSRAGELYRQWLETGVLVSDPVPSIYYLEEDYVGEEGPRTRRGFVAAVRLESPESGLYRPHEKTLAGPKADRLNLMRACPANLSPIFGLYDDPADVLLPELAAAASGSPALTSVRNDDGVESRLWRLSDPALVARVAEALLGKSFFIADGHHRYETALTYRDLLRQQTPGFSGREPWNHVMMYLTNLWSPGLSVLPTHRVVFGLPDLRLDAFLSRVGENFRVEEVSGGSAALTAALRARAGTHAFGLVAKGDPALRLLTLRDEAVLGRHFGGRLPEVLWKLDVTVLHSLILEAVLGIGEEAQANQRNLRYVKGAEALVRAVREEDGDLGFLLNATRVAEVKSVAEQGEKMPQKSTFFYPKLVTGLVLHALHER